MRNADVDLAAAPGLRERSKAKRRVAIQRAALRLFAERGYDNATIADIADAAEVAPRTISLYFPTKLDIALSTSSDIAVRLTATFASHPGASFSTVVERWLRAEAGAADPELAALTTAMFEANPALRAVSNTQITEVTAVAAPALLAESGLDADDPMARIVGAAVTGVLSEYLPAALAGDRLPESHAAVMRYLRSVITAASPR